MPAGPSAIKSCVGSGGVPTPPSGTLADNEMVKANVGGTAIVGTGDTNTPTEVDFGSKDVRCKSVITEAGSVDVGPALTISERGGYQQNHSDVSGKSYIGVEYEIDDTGTQKPTYDVRGPLDVNVVKQPIDTSIMLNVTNYSFTPSGSEDVKSVRLKFSNSVTNFRMQYVSVATGNPIKYFPSENDWRKETGVSFAAGEQVITFDTPLAEIDGVSILVNIMADGAVDLLGDGVDPYRAVDRQVITSHLVVTDLDYPTESVSTSLIEGGEVTANGTTAVDIAAGSGRIVSFDINGAPTVEEVNWDAIVNFNITNILTQSGTRLAIDSAGQVVELPVAATTQTNRDYINISVVAHAAGTIGRITNTGFTNREVYAQYVDSLQSLGVTRRKGLDILPNAASLTFEKKAGELEAVGAGIESGNRGQNTVALNAQATALFTRALGLTDTPVGVLQTDIDPSNYDIGSGVPEPVGVPASRATIQYVFQSILQPGGLFVMYGQTIYDTLDDAVLNAPSDRVVVPDLIQGSANLIGRIAVRADATDISDPLQAEFLTGAKFGTGIGGGGFGGGGVGGGDYNGPASSVTDEIHTYADTTGKSGKSGSDIVAVSGGLQRSTPNADLDLVSNGLGSINIDGLRYPKVDGFAGDTLRTNGAGQITLGDDNYLIANANTLLTKDIKRVYADASTGDITLTLGNNPRNGERKTIWVGDKTNIITLESVNPAFPISPPPQIGEGNIEGQWTLTSDFLDRYAPTSRDLTQQGTGGAFVPATINGDTVNVYDFQGTSYLESTAPVYKGIIGSTTRSFTTWYVANAGQPAGNETIVSWGDGAAGGGRFWVIEFVSSVQELQVDIKNARRGYTYATLNAANLFDGNPHHIAVVMSGAFCINIELYVDGVVMAKGPIDNSPSMNTISNHNFKLGAYITGGNILNGQLYDSRLFNRAISLNELNEIINEDLSGGVNLSAADKDMVFDVVYNGASWELGVGTEALALTNEANISALDARVTSLEGASASTVVFEMQRLSSYSIPVGFDQTVNYSTVFRYEVDGAPATPVMSGGVWTVDITGWYQISVEGWLDRGDIGYDTDFVILTVARNGQNYTTTNPAATENLLIGEARHLGSPGVSSSMFLNAGDTVEIKTRNIGSTTTWDFTNFTWKAVKVG